MNILSHSISFISRTKIAPGATEIITRSVHARGLAGRFSVHRTCSDLEFTLAQEKTLASGMVNGTDLSRLGFLKEGDIELRVHNPTDHPIGCNAGLQYLTRELAVPK